MKPSLWNWFTAGLRHLPGILTVAALLALLAWGHVNDWKLPRIGSGQKDDETSDKEDADPTRTRVTTDDGATVSADPAARSTHLLRIVFRSEEDVKHTGLATAPAELRSMAEHVVANGVLAFDQTRYAQLASRAAGTVWAVPKRAGDRVQAGDVLALVDSLEVGKCKADLLQSIVQHDLKRQVLERLHSGDGSIPDRQLREAEAAYREAQVRLLYDRQALANLGLPVRLEDFAGRTDEQIFQYLRLLGLPEAVQKELQHGTGSAGLLPLVAPFAGEVIRCHAVRGEVVGPTQLLFVVAATDPLWILLDVRLEDVQRLRVGQPVSFSSDDGGAAPARGTLALISAEADPKTRTVRARAALTNPSGQLRPNTFGTGRVLIQQQPKAVAVPLDAVQQDGSAALVFVRLGPTVFQVRQVETGLRDGGFVEIRRGVAADESVVTTGSHALKSELRKDLIVDND